MYFPHTYQKPTLAEWQQSNKEFSKHIDYNYHAADLLSLVKVSGKSHRSAGRISPCRTLGSLVLLGFLGLPHRRRPGKHGHPLPMAPRQPAAKEILLQLQERKPQL